MIFDLINIFIPVFAAIVLHEIAHGYAAFKLGDDTAYRYGRLSLNPLNHIDIFGTILLPLILWRINSPFMFGWAKPVPVNFSRLRHRRRDTVIVASAGIVTNALLAGLALLIFKFLPNLFCANLVMINLALIFFNILPFPPLDGSKIFFGWIDRPWAQKYVAAERQGMMVLISVIVIIPLIANAMGHPSWDILGWYMTTMFRAVLGG